MRILVVTGIFPPDHGGPASYVPAVCQALAARHEILAVITLSDMLGHDDSGYGFPVVRIGRNQWFPGRWLKTVLRICRLASRADVVYLNGLVLEGVVACKLLSRRKIVVKVVGDLIWEKARNVSATVSTIDAFQRERHALKWRALQWLQSWYTRKADRVIVPSRYLAGLVRGWGINERQITVVYNAVDPPRPDETHKDWDIVTVARLVPWKGVDVLIRLACTHGWSLLIVGDGPLRGSLEALVDELGARPNVRFTGHVTKASVTTYIRSARVFVLNSSYEGLPHIVLEAKAAGVPVVATAVGGTPETIDEGVDGYLVSEGDTSALARIIGCLIGDRELRERIGRAAQRTVRDRFSFSRMIADTEKCLVGAGISLQPPLAC